MALMAFNVFNFSSISAVCEASAKTRLPVYLQLSESTVRYYGAETLKLMVAAASPWEGVALHLDHCADPSIILDCAKAGWDSVMADYSRLPLAENIRETRQIVTLMDDFGVKVEGELGGVAGVEDDFLVGASNKVIPEEAAIFMNETGVELLAIGIGNAHGVYQSTESIDYELFKSVHQCVPDTKLVLHGATGIPQQRIDELKQYGLHKINYSTGLKEAYYSSVRDLVMSEERSRMLSYFDSPKTRIMNLITSLIRNSA